VTTTANRAATDELSAALRTAIGRVYRRFRALRAQGELGDAAMSVLTRLRKEGTQTLTQLSDDARVTPSSMSQVVNRLEQGGFLVRSADPADGRRVLFHLTDEGRRIEHESIARSRAWFDGHLEALSDADRAVLARAAEILHRVADAPAPESEED
jgi:DNA-binding MarR family transcriptional regulator